MWNKDNRLLQSRYGLPHYAYLTRRTSHFFMPTIFVTYLMLDSYGQPHFFIDTVPCPLPCSTYDSFLVYKYSSTLFINLYVSLYLHVYKPMYLDVEP